MSVRSHLGLILVGLVLVACSADTVIGSTTAVTAVSKPEPTKSVDSTSTPPATTTTGGPSDLSTTLDLLDGSKLEVVGPSELHLSGYAFTIEVPELGSSNVDLTRGADPTDASAVDEAAVLESNLGHGVRLWLADREGQPFYMTVDLGGWVAFLHVGNETAPDTELLLSLAGHLQGEGGEDGVVLADYEPPSFTAYLSDPSSENQIHLAANQCVKELVAGAEVVENPTRGEVIRGPEYASWCDEDADIGVTAYGTREFVDRVLDELTLNRQEP